MTSYLNALLKQGSKISEVIEPQTNQDMLDEYEDIKDESSRPMRLLISAKEKI